MTRSIAGPTAARQANVDLAVDSGVPRSKFDERAGQRVCQWVARHIDLIIASMHLDPRVRLAASGRSCCAPRVTSSTIRVVDVDERVQAR